MNKLKYNKEIHHNNNSYFWLLIFFMTLLFFPIFSVFFRTFSEIVFKISASLIILWGAYVVTDNEKDLRTCSILALLAIAGIWLGEYIFQSNIGAIIFQTLTSIIYFGYLGKRISIQLLRNTKQVNLNLVYGAVIVFFIIGIIGGELCTLMDIMEPGTFFIHEEKINTYNYYYFSFVTLTTVGYGDFTPTNESGRALALLIGLLGQIYLTIAMAIIIGKYLNQEDAS